MKKPGYKRVLWIALPLVFAAGCAHTAREASTAPDSSETLSPTSDRSAPRVYSEEFAPMKATSPPQGANTTDWAMAEKLRFMLTTNQALASSPVAAIVNGGTVTLKGEVPTSAERDRVHAAVASVPGVEKVDDQLEIRNPAGRWKGESRNY